ncbi:MAG: ABC transporter permease [Cytophagales bacterium]|nr:MAG: ABC transporter permease [Cytophagales bacterium]
MKIISFNKLLLIAKREFTVAIRKKSFLWLTILGPIIFSGLMILPVWMGMNANEKPQLIVCDLSDNQFFKSNFSIPNIDIITIPIDSALAKKTFLDSKIDAILFLNFENLLIYKSSIITKKSFSLSVLPIINTHINLLNKDFLISNLAIEKTTKDTFKTYIEIEHQFINTENSKNSENIKSVLSLSLAILIYFFIIMYGMQVMRSVQEEKSNRIVEIIATSIKPFELMAGKILGVAAVSLTQFMIWLMLTSGVSSCISSNYKLERFSDKNIENTISKMKPIDYKNALEMNQIVAATDEVSVLKTVILFVIYFIFGYLLYASLFAAIGAAVDSESDVQQFLFPITFPLLATFLFAQSIIQNPNSSISFGLSMFPFTSPIAMLVRFPFEISFYEILISIFILIISMFFVLYASSKIYRTGLLLYGKKITFGEMLKWAVK